MNRDAIDKFVNEWAKEWSALDVSHLQTIGRIWRISEHLRRCFDVWLQPYGLNWETFDVIVSLRRSGPHFRMRPTELSEACLLTSGAMTNRLDRVERIGLIARRPAPDDRRSVQVELTPKGIALAEQVIEAHFGAARQLLECLNEREQQTLADLLRKVLAMIEPAEDAMDSSDRMTDISSSKPAKSKGAMARQSRSDGPSRESRATAKDKGKRARRPV